MIPISDENPARLKPIVNWVLIALCIGTFFWQLSFSVQAGEELIDGFGFVPSSLLGDARTASIAGTPSPWLTLISSMFLHGGFMHLGGNMLYLWIFGNNVEDAMGHGRFVLFYLACGVLAALAEGVADPQSTLPLIGASGAISGVLASYLLIFPRARVTVIIPLGIFLYPTKISALYVIGFWFLLQILNVFITSPGTPGTAWWAHVGGFAAGIVLTPFLSHFPLLGRRTPGPWG